MLQGGIVLIVVFSNVLSPITCRIPECKVIETGTDYLGEESVTASGLPCQRWDAQEPHGHDFTDPRLFPDVRLEDAADFCRNPNERRAGPWCYTTDLDVEWEFCNISYCPDQPECKLTALGTEYRGSLSVTVSGRTCSDPCRNPDERPDGPWCFTEDPDTEWEYCDVPFCKPSADCRNTELGQNYIGTVSWTRTGRKCQRWDRQAPHDHEDTDPEDFPDETLEDAENFCRNPNGDSSGPWCYTIDPALRSESCSIPVCKDCKTSSSGRDYAGTLSQTVSGVECQRWDIQSPHPHDLTDPNRFPDASLAEAVNYCRNPDSREGGSWCYTQDPDVEWDYCDIPDCEGSASTDWPRVPFAKHFIHIGVDGLHPGCMEEAPGGAPNMLQRLALEGTSTRTRARTTLATWSAPGWMANLCSLGTENTGITGNGWLPPWRGNEQPITPITGNDVPLPCVFQTIKSQDASVRTGLFYYWEWIRHLGSQSDPGTLDREMRCRLGISTNPVRNCDTWLTGNVTEYLRDVFTSSERSYTFILLGNADEMGHIFGWCGNIYLQEVAYVDDLVGQILDVLDEEDMWDDAIVALSSDHGGQGLTHGRWQDSDTNIPLFLRGKGIRQQHEFEHGVHNQDIVPTALYTLGLQSSPWMKGKVLWEAFEEGQHFMSQKT